MSASYLLTGHVCIKLGTSIEVEGSPEGIPWWLWWFIIPSGVSLGLLSPYSISLDVENISTSLDVDCGWGSQHGVRWPAISINNLKQASKEMQYYGITAWMEEGVDNSNHHSPNPRQITVIWTESHWMQLDHFLQPYTALDTLLTILLTLGGIYIVKRYLYSVLMMFIQLMHIINEEWALLHSLVAFFASLSTC